jgi:hypothetical protein
MKKIQEEKEKSITSNVETGSFYQKSPKTKEHKTKEILVIKATSPTTVSCELPILFVLSGSPEKGMRALTVVREVASSTWFAKLTDQDRESRYPLSRKKIVSTTVRWARENLALRGEIYLPGNECKAGVWRPTSKGVARAKEYEGKWTPKYTTHNAIIILDPNAKNKSTGRADTALVH